MTMEARARLVNELNLAADPGMTFGEMAASDKAQLFRACYDLGACPGCGSTFGHVEGCTQAMRRLAVDAIASGRHSVGTISELMRLVDKQ